MYHDQHIVVGMSAIPSAARSTPRTDSAPRVLEAGIALFAFLYLVEALFMAVSPHGFYKSVGGFDSYNPHYLRDVASFSAAIGIGLAVSLWRPSWRVPALAITTAQYALHSVNHLFDIDIAHPQWTGYFDFFSLAAATLVLVWLLRRAIPCERESANPHDRKELSP
jgi:hypothetical protein